ncbi:hypothetical protein ATANTOWER_016794 [Ataeniobius toweri]|uniref:Uncharacterized protein n=1 Tax=Ataeniobius toweri TaxID=208326 RepID=A0ABU7C2U7_9TELE|nr:hypothetical protein [Ataeniobius toweri]
MPDYAFWLRCFGIQLSSANLKIFDSFLEYKLTWNLTFKEECHLSISPQKNKREPSTFQPVCPWSSLLGHRTGLGNEVGRGY